MKKICDYCSHQKSDGNGGVECGKATYHIDPDGYGTFKHGALCVYDIDLSDLFESRDGNNKEIYNLSQAVKNLREKNIKIQYEKDVLKSRLTKISDGKD